MDHFEGESSNSRDPGHNERVIRLENTFENLSEDQTNQALRELREAILSGSPPVLSIPVKLLSPFLWYPQSFFTDQIRGNFQVNWDELMSYLSDLIAGRPTRPRCPWATSPPEVPVAGAPPYVDPQWTLSHFGGENPFSLSNFGTGMPLDPEEEEFASHFSIFPTDDFRFSRCTYVRRRTIPNLEPMTGPWFADPSIPLAPLPTDNESTHPTNSGSSAPNQPDMAKKNKSEPQLTQKSQSTQDCHATSTNPQFAGPSTSFAPQGINDEGTHPTNNGSSAPNQPQMSNENKPEPQFSHDSQTQQTSQETDEMRANPHFVEPSAPPEEELEDLNQVAESQFVNNPVHHIYEHTNDINSNRFFMGTAVPLGPYENIKKHDRQGPILLHHDQHHQKTNEINPNPWLMGPTAPSAAEAQPNLQHLPGQSIHLHTNEIRPNPVLVRSSVPLGPHETIDARKNEGQQMFAHHPGQSMHMHTSDMRSNPVFVDSAVQPSHQTIDAKRHECQPPFLLLQNQHHQPTSEMNPNPWLMGPSAPFAAHETIDARMHEGPAIPQATQETVDARNHKSQPHNQERTMKIGPNHVLVGPAVSHGPHNATDSRKHEGQPQFLLHQDQQFHQNANDVRSNSGYVPTVPHASQETVNVKNHEGHPSFQLYPGQHNLLSTNEMRQTPQFVGPTVPQSWQNPAFVGPTVPHASQETVNVKNHEGHPSFQLYPGQHNLLSTNEMRQNPQFVGPTVPQSWQNPAFVRPTVPHASRESIDARKQESQLPYPLHTPVYILVPSNEIRQNPTFVGPACPHATHETVDSINQGQPQFLHHPGQHFFQPTDERRRTHQLVGPSAQFVPQESLDARRHQAEPLFFLNPVQQLHQRTSEVRPNPGPRILLCTNETLQNLILEGSAVPLVSHETVDARNHEGQSQFPLHPGQHIYHHGNEINPVFLATSVPHASHETVDTRRDKVKRHSAHHYVPQDHHINETRPKSWLLGSSLPRATQRNVDAMIQEQQPRFVHHSAPRRLYEQNNEMRSPWLVDLSIQQETDKVRKHKVKPKKSHHSDRRTQETAAQETIQNPSVAGPSVPLTNQETVTTKKPEPEFEIERNEKGFSLWFSDLYAPFGPDEPKAKPDPQTSSEDSLQTSPQAPAQESSEVLSLASPQEASEVLPQDPPQESSQALQEAPPLAPPEVPPQATSEVPSQASPEDPESTSRDPEEQYQVVTHFVAPPFSSTPTIAPVVSPITPSMAPLLANLAPHLVQIVTKVPSTQENRSNQN